jgi:hypothetical protein
MLGRINKSRLRCPKCDSPMTLVTEPPHFAQFLPWRSFTCELCRISLSYPSDDEEGGSYREADALGLPEA